MKQKIIKKNSVARGLEAELIFTIECLKRNFVVSTPLSHQSEYDLIIDNGKLYKVQVKRVFLHHNKRCIDARRMLSRYSYKKYANPYTKSAFDYLVAVDCIKNDIWIIPKKFTLNYKGQILLDTKKGIENYKNVWTI